jgi:hypothetical protein
MVTSRGHGGVGVEERELSLGEHARDDGAAGLETPERAPADELSDEGGLAFGEREQVGGDRELV